MTGLLCRSAVLYPAHTQPSSGFIFVYAHLLVHPTWPSSHLYFSHHIVIRLHVHSEGLSHLSLTVIQDLNLHKVFLLALLECHILKHKQ